VRELLTTKHWIFCLGLTMAASREGVRLARALRQRLSIHQSAPLCARGFASTRVAQNATVKAGNIADIESTSSFSTPQPDKDAIKAFEESQKQDNAERRLPGNRYVLPSQTQVGETSLMRIPDTNTTLPSIIEAHCIQSRRRLRPIQQLVILPPGHSTSLA
jgi:hypothetical protein